MREIKVHAESGPSAASEGAAALGVDVRRVEVEVLEADEHGVTARVWVTEDAAPAAPDRESPAGGEPDRESPADDDGEATEGAAAACRHLARVLELIGLETQVAVVSEREDEVVLNVEGDDLGVIIGSFGQTLNALQFLVNLMANRHGPRQRVIIDAGGYRDRRREKLEEIAQQHARRAKDERRGVILEGLRASERRIIHTALQNDPDVVTFSEGEEPHRRLIISPRNR